MASSIEYQKHKAAQINTLLGSIEHIDLETYKAIMDVLPATLSARLRLVPDKSLPGRLAHLYEVTQLCLGHSSDFPGTELESFEGLSLEFTVDCDVVLRNKTSSVFYFIDVTASTNIHVLEEKQRVVDSTALRYKDEYRATVGIVHQFVPYRFSWVLPLAEADSHPETVAITFVEFMTGGSTRSTEPIYAQIDKLYDAIIPKLADVNHAGHLYKTKKPSDKLLTAARECLSSNDVDSMAKLYRMCKKADHKPYLDAVMRLSEQSHTIKHVMRYPPAIIKRHNNLETALSSLRDDLLAYALYVSMTSLGKVVLMKKNKTYMLADGFPKDSTDKRMISSDLGYAIACKHVKGHIFTIKFAYDEMCPNLRRIMKLDHATKTRVDKTMKSSLEKSMDTLRNSDSEVERMKADMLSRNNDTLISTIWDKVNTMCNLTARDLGSVGTVSTNMLSKISSIIRRSYLGAAVAHRYEVAQSFTASLKSSSKGANYYVGVNGTFDSVTITKMNSTQDSYRTKHYCVVGRTSSRTRTSMFVKPCSMSTKNVFRSEFYTMNPNELVYDIKIPYVALSLITWDLENNLKDGRVGEDQIPDMIASNFLHTLVNRDVFAQASQQSRYFYMSAIGYGANPSKITEKFDFFTPKYNWEILYVFRMLKMGLCLSIIRDSGSMSSSLIDGELPVVFPHSRFPCRSFNQAVSSMYYSNVFNKFRAFQEVSASICYNELDDENDIYKKVVKQNRQNLVGFSAETEANITNKEYLSSDKFFENELAFALELMKSPASRFKSSCCFILAATRRHLKPGKKVIDQIYSDLGKSPISACTMRGSMDHKASSDSGQAIRAASAIMEELFIERGYDPEKINKNPILAQQFLDEISKDDKSYSIFSSVITQIGRDTIYRYRVTPKDQTGHREISVLNAVFRLGALFYETVAANLSTCLKKYDLLENSSKEIVFEDAVKSATNQKNYPTVFYDNSDQKRWGPNHMLHFFSVMMLGALADEPGLARLLNMVSQKTFNKRAKFPESLIRFFNTRKLRKTGDKVSLTSLGSEAMATFYERHYDDLMVEVYDTNYRYGMCQGIFHSTSSVFHAVMAACQDDATRYIYGNNLLIEIFVTSDDASRIIKSNNRDFIPAMVTQHNMTISLGNLMNIIRNDSKSAFNPHIAEFNSVFYKNGVMATPSIKQRVSKIDVGSGENHYEDFLSALANASGYFSAGGSYSGAVILAILNLVLHTEQWNRWEFCNMEQFFKPVELGGFPVVEPFTTSICGAVSNMFLRAPDSIASEDYAKIYVNNITSKPEAFSLSDFSRLNVNNLSSDNADLKIFRNAGPMGLFCMLRTDKKLSMFDRRNKMSKWNIPDSFASLIKSKGSARNFIFNVSRTADMTLHDTPEGINSFYIRYSDPWVSATRKIMRVSSSSSLRSLGFSHGDVLSYQEIKGVLLSKSHSESEAVLKGMYDGVEVDALTDMLVKQMAVKMRDARTILEFITNQECETFTKPNQHPSTTRLTLKGTTPQDKDNYTLCLIKYLAGPKSRDLITESRSNSKVYDLLPDDFNGQEISIKESVVLADNSLNAFEKYIKTSTKMICAGRPADLTSIITLILSNRFTESAGVKLTGKLRVPGDVLNTFSYTGWYRDLATKSRQSLNIYSNQVLKRSYAHVLKYGVISAKRVVTSNEDFELTEDLGITKTVLLNPKRRSELSRSVRDWSVANVGVNLTFGAINLLFDGALTSSSEFLTGDRTMTRVCSSKYLDVEVNFQKALHIMSTQDIDGEVRYLHEFLVPSGTPLIITKAERSKTGMGDKWVDTIASMLNEQKRRIYNVNCGNDVDTIRFLEIGTETDLKPTVINGTLTCALMSPQICIPICHVAITNLNDIDMADSVTHEDIVTATLVYKDLADRSSNFENLDKPISKFLEQLLFKTSYNCVNKHLTKLIDQLSLDLHSFGQIDILKALIISDRKLKISISPSKLFGTLNNLGVESTSRASHISSVSIDQRVILEEKSDEILVSLGDLMDDVEMEEMHEDDSEEDRSDIDSEGNSIVLSALEDFDFDMDDLFADEDDDDLEDILTGLNLTSTQIDNNDAISRSVRTNHSLNPVDEYPGEILKLSHEWLDGTSVPRTVGFGFKIESFIDVLRYYSTLIFSGQTDPNNILQNFYGEDSIKPILPLSLLASINES